MDLTLLGQAMLTEAVSGAVDLAPKVSPLQGVDPRGRVDVLASRLLERVVVTSCGPMVAGAYPRLKPAIDDLIVKALKQFAPGSPAKCTGRSRPRRSGGKTRTGKGANSR